MADPRRFELDELVNRPGSYFNPQTEVLVVVDDSPEMDAEIFNMEEFEGADWVLISDEVPVDEDQRDRLLETFQTRHAGADLEADPDEEPEEFEEEEELRRDEQDVAGLRRARPAQPSLTCRCSAARRTSGSSGCRVPAFWMHWLYC